MTRPLILAIAPDRANVPQLKSIASRVNADLRLTDSVEAALAALSERIPDLILTPPLLSARDDMALAGRLRALGDTAAHIQTLTIPSLRPVEPPLSGIFAALRRDKPRARPAGPEACETTTFAEQVSVYLKGAMEARRRHATPVAAPDASASSAPSHPSVEDRVDAPRPSPSRHDDGLMSMEEFDLSAFLSQQVPDPLPVPAVNEPPVFDDLSAFLPEIEEAVASPPARAMMEDLTQFMTEEPRHRIDDTFPTSPDQLSEFVSEAPLPAASETRPTYDSWHFFDPDQPRFAALLARLDAIAATDENRSLND